MSGAITPPPRPPRPYLPAQPYQNAKEGDKLSPRRNEAGTGQSSSEVHSG